jgi:hypothetical protein
MNPGISAVVALWFGAAFALATLAKSFGATSPSGVTITSVRGTTTTLTPAQLASLPAVTETVSFGTDHGVFKASFSGPLL